MKRGTRTKVVDLFAALKNAQPGPRCAAQRLARQCNRPAAFGSKFCAECIAAPPPAPTAGEDKKP